MSVRTVESICQHYGYGSRCNFASDNKVPSGVDSIVTIEGTNETRFYCQFARADVEGQMTCDTYKETDAEIKTD